VTEIYMGLLFLWTYVIRKYKSLSGIVLVPTLHSKLFNGDASISEVM